MIELELYRPSRAVEYDRSKPALLFGSTPELRSRAERALIAADLRLVGSLDLEEGAARLDDQVSLGLVWLELGDTYPVALDTLLARLNAHAELYGTVVIAASPFGIVDAVEAKLTHPLTEILVDPDNAQRAATVALAMTSDLRRNRLNDVGRDEAARLRQLSDEMGRIAATLARLSVDSGGPAVKPSSGKDAPANVDVETVRAVIRARRKRYDFFSEELFADPAWDMLLDLLQAEIAQLRVSISSLCLAAAVPATTALRWIKTMTEQGLFVRRADPYDRRRVYVELAPLASDAMRRYFAKVGRPIGA